MTKLMFSNLRWVVVAGLRHYGDSLSSKDFFFKKSLKQWQNVKIFSGKSETILFLMGEENDDSCLHRNLPWFSEKNVRTKANVFSPETEGKRLVEHI